jgi:hypothetical protein
VRRALAVAAALALAGCGTPSPDLFEVTRSGRGQGADVRMLVSDGGIVSCNGEDHTLDPDRLLTARALARDLATQAELGLELPSGPGTQLSYRVRLEEGTVAFGDRSRDLPGSFNRLVAFTADVAERVCGIMR